MLLSELEMAVMKRMAQSNEWLQPHIQKLRVLDRELTGVGSYTNFERNSSAVSVPDCHIGLDALISVPGLPNGMGAVLFVREGHMSFLELFVYGEDLWNGEYYGFSLSENA